MNSEIQLSSEEQREYERQQKELKHPAFHESIKCGQVLVHRAILKKHAKLNRLYCPTHHLYVSMNGWEIGWSLGTYSKHLNSQ